MTSRLEHLVLTRFSVRFTDDSEPFPRSWLEDRLRLLEAFCLPALVEQTSTRFRWLLLCDESTSPGCLSELAALTAEVPSREIVLTSRSRPALGSVIESLQGSTRALLTTRLDSDDGIAVDLVERIQAYADAFLASGRETLLVNFSQGQTLDLDDGAIYDGFQPQGPFASLFERIGSGRESLKTVYSGNHGHLYLEHPLHIDASEAAWLQVIHGHNVSNHVRDTDLPSPAGLAPAFRFDPEPVRRLNGAPPPQGERIRAAGERGTEGIY